jgi:hypothetical protein
VRDLPQHAARDAAFEVDRVRQRERALETHAAVDWGRVARAKGVQLGR